MMPGMARARPYRVLLLALLAACVPPGRSAAGPQGDVTFFAIGDPQINSARWGTAGTDSTVVLMNGLPGQPFAFGGVVAEPAGVIVAGDLVDDVRSTEDRAYYRTLFDPERGKARLRFPAYEGLGNHDVDVRGQPPGVFHEHQREFIARNRRRAGDFRFDEHGYHYSWEWGGVRFIQLNLFPGTAARPVYDAPAPGNDPRGGLAFLRRVLQEEVGASGQPIIATWHYGLRGWGLEKWWRPEDLDSLAAVLEGHNVLLLLHGHEHRFERYRWHGYDVVMAPSPQDDRDPEQPQTASRPKGFLVFRITSDELQLAHRTAAGWADTWSKPISRPGAAAR
jgi:cytolysin (calcineurin-like family phosphatase)